jgi:integrase
LTYPGIREHISYCEAGGLSESTIRARLRVLMRVESDIGEVDGLHSRKLADWLGNEEWSPQTRKSYFGHLDAYYIWALKVGKVDINPMRDLQRPPIPRRSPPRPARLTDYQRIMAEAEPRWRIAVALAYFGGLKAAEIARLVRADVDENHIRVRGNNERAATRPMHPAIWELVRELPEGPLVLGASGRAFNASTITTAFTNHMSKLGMGNLGLVNFRHLHDIIERFDDTKVAEFLASSEGVASVYRKNPEAFRSAIEDDVSARDLVALAYRRQQLDRFRRLLNDPKYFESERLNVRGGAEKVWQDFLEMNSWILGVGVGGQLFTAWDPEKLEQTVRGASILGSGKRIDALMRTSGRIRSLVFAEIKHHKTELLQLVRSPYRGDCWAPSYELSGGITQIQQTVDLAVHSIGERRIPDRDTDGNEIVGEFTYVVRPRSYLIAGTLGELCGPDGGINRAKYHSFELYRRNLYEPDVLTFDELLARAEWHVLEAEETSIRRRNG